MKLMRQKQVVILIIAVVIGIVFWLVIKNNNAFEKLPGNESETVEYPPMPTEEEFSQNNVVNINTATVNELETLPGIGPSKAAAIVEYREVNGDFATTEEIMEVEGIGEKTYEDIKQNITVN